MASYEQGAAGWLYQRLRNGPGVALLVETRIYETQAPQGAIFPYVLYTFNSGQDVPTVGGKARIFTKPLYAVRGYVKETSFSTADAIASAIDDTLQVGEPSAATVAGTVWYCSAVREQGLRGIETDQGLQYRFSGGLYRLFVSL